MSRVGKYPIAVPQGVTVELKDDVITVKGKKATLSTKLLGNVKVTHQNGEIVVEQIAKGKFARAMWGTTRANIKNLITGVTDGFTKGLEIQGVGYRCSVKGKVLILALGYSHDIYYQIPEGIEIKVDKQVSLDITGADKKLVGQVAAEIREFRKPEPYKGKGVRYRNEYVRIKEGKKK
jgi:large subunit ribosomal protein L6